MTSDQEPAPEAGSTTEPAVTFPEGPGPQEQSFSCPRCHQTVTTRFYGPCDQCRQSLRAALGGESRAVEAAEYEPKMNVTPNAVATKD